MTHYIRTLTFGLSLAMTLVASTYAADASDSKTTTQAAAQQGDPLVREAATRHTPPWTNDSANIHNDRMGDRGSLQPASPWTAASSLSPRT